MRRVCVNVKNGALGGAAYNGVPEISNAPRAARYLVTLRLGRGRERWPLGPVNYHFKAPAETGPRNRFPFFVCHDWREWLVKLAAHEAKHIEQFRARRRMQRDRAARSTRSNAWRSAGAPALSPPAEEAAEQLHALGRVSTLQTTLVCTCADKRPVRF